MVEAGQKEEGLTGCWLVIHVVVGLIDGRSLVLWLTNHRRSGRRVDVGQDAAGDSLRDGNITGGLN